MQWKSSKISRTKHTQQALLQDCVEELEESDACRSEAAEDDGMEDEEVEDDLEPLSEIARTVHGRPR
eukprot:4496760-Amphidinium_carterae.1